ncbi:type VI secretion protein [Deinococcus arenae]|uniref:Type VI secretion protein n=1 Tax=Deinococcus arenae TaxID=1452751 RepID=A0A8H9L8U5_9DEIO|nr:MULTISPECIES: PAAR domain-containing protein [Deinococcus]AWT37781.1 type VI secretion protein [Deinococcus actinosclerus]GGM38744.1 type VI secretion protein [Deinococcus arenae]
MPPAARTGDHHTCPMYDGKSPHVGGPVSAGSSTVRIGGQPAARVGDRCVCSGPPDTIVRGSATVRINGQMAARLGDMTAHGGQIVAGAPTVNIGG